MNRIYVYQLDDQSVLSEIMEFSDRTNVEYDRYRLNSRKKFFFRVPAGCAHSMFLLRFGDSVSLVDKTWEMGSAKEIP